MATFTPNEMNLSQINGGNRFVNGDIVEADTLNKVIEGVAYAQENGGSGSGGGSSVEVVQSTGTSTTAVMSQKATTEAINSAKPQFSVDPIDGSLVISGGSNFVYTPPSGGGGGNKTLYRHDCYFSGSSTLDSSASVHCYITAYTPNPQIDAQYLEMYATQHDVTATGYFDSDDGRKGIILAYRFYPEYYGEGAFIVYQAEGTYTGLSSIGMMSLSEFTMQVTTTQII